MIGIDSIKPHYEIRAVDTDPDTGECRNWAMAITMEKQMAEAIVIALNLSNEEPNRLYSYIHREEIIK